MARNQDSEVERTDLETHLGALADHLRVYGEALRGMATEGGDGTTLESRVHADLAGRLNAFAHRLDCLRTHLCPACRMIEVIERVSVVRGTGHSRRPGRARHARGGRKD
jgi:hypothetical protein